ncbi:TadE/TadG family type IV pilus assembly protein [Streptomyces noursei]|uniref:TadE/TadG family type IV pilus assembly protein n=1 Tax=Streptomyces noursei TaxID=1971 RepID=UPI00081D1398|nr:TadE-like protein [Streptomyces noursei ATCC 11455]ANZ21936.1 TadE-like protein [Streptomyces noursei ATCC 11455]MCZ0996531.1 pilus assembly protein [Streptomyces noursei]
MAIVLPAIIVLTLAVVQAGLWFLARGIALTAAREGAAAARSYHATLGQGQERARSVLDRTAGDLLTGATVQAAGTGERVRIEVTGRALSLLPGVPGLQITQVATGPIERYTSPGG